MTSRRGGATLRFLLLTLLVASTIILAAWIKIPSFRDGMRLLAGDAVAAVQKRV